VERGKPHERETQILVGAPNWRNKTKVGLPKSRDKCLPPIEV